MMWLFAVLIVLAMGGVALIASGRGRPMSEEYGDRPDSLVPAAGPVRAEDLRRIRFSLAVRGYRMSEVDGLLDRLARQLEESPAPAADPPTQTDPPAESDPPAKTGGDADSGGPDGRGPAT